MKRLFLFAVFLFGISACSEDHEKEPVASDGNVAPLYILYSPNGEPLNGGPLGRPSCKQALSGWFTRVSAGHDGHIPVAIFLEDATTQFAHMDIDHHGFLVSEELDRFREPYRQPQNAVPDETKSQKKHDGHKGTQNKYTHSDPSLSMSDPVMSADSNLDFKVTPEEFAQQAQDIFAKLDAHHDGALSLEEILTLCEKKES